MIKSYKFIYTLPTSTRANPVYVGVTLLDTSKRNAIARFKSYVDDDEYKAAFTVEEVH